MTGTPPASIFVAFLLSTKCNLECTYCNVDAGPKGRRPVLEPHLFEAWIHALCALEPAEIAVQLHGGEPLIVDPPVELFAAIARNALARHPRTRLVDLSIQSNGIALDERRLDSLERAGVRIRISIDGPSAIHDRQRPFTTGRGSQPDAVRAHRLLRERGQNTPVIAVVTDPDDVMPVLDYFIADGYPGARMNPLRPQGRGAGVRDWDDATFMRRMAAEYARAARTIARHNGEHPDAPFYEDNLAKTMELLIGEGEGPDGSDCALFVDDRGNLWSHPGTYGVDLLHRVKDAPPTAADLRRALGVADGGNGGLSGALHDLYAHRFTACPTCPTPQFCVRFYAPKPDSLMSRQTCAWRMELTDRLAAWLRTEPEMAHRIVPPRRAAPDY